MIGLKSVGFDVSVIQPEAAPYGDLLTSTGVSQHELPKLAEGFGYQDALTVRRILGEWPTDVLWLIDAPAQLRILAAIMGNRVRVVVSLRYLEGVRVSFLHRMVYRSARVTRLLVDADPAAMGDAVTARLLDEKINVIKPGHDARWYQSPDDLSEFGIPNGVFTVASVADHSGRTGLEQLTDCARWLPMDLPIHFLLMAPGDAHEQLRRSIRKIPFTQRFHLTDRLSEAPAILAAASAALVTGYATETQRRAAMQAMASGVPLLGVRGRVMSQLIEPEVNGVLLPPGDPEALAQCIFELYENNERRTELGAGAERIFHERFDMARMLQETRAALEAVV